MIESNRVKFLSVAFLTTIFPIKKEILYDFFNSLEKQTYKEFDLIVVNDGFEGFGEFKKKYNSLNIIELKHSNTPAKNREYGINWCINNGYDILIFGDSDDYFESNRVEVSIKKLKHYDIVVNDLTLFNEKKIISEKYFSNRLSNNQIIDFNFIKEKNIFGFTNTALKVKALDKSVSFDENIIAVDWFLFTLLLLKGKTAIFTNETVTYYRQYDKNLIGLGNLDIDRIKKTIDVKLNHYSLLSKINPSFNNLKENLEKNIEKLDIILTKQKNLTHPFWWEEI